MKKLLLLTLFAFNTMAHEDNTIRTNHITFGGWSYHNTDTEKQKYDYNQVHNGLGYERFWQTKGDKYSLGLGGWYMTDSYRKSAFHLGATWRYHLSPRIKVSLAATLMNRGKRVKNTLTTSKGTDLTEYKIKRANMFVIVPYVTLDIYDNLSFDLMWMPNFDDETGVTFARFNYQF